MPFRIFVLIKERAAMNEQVLVDFHSFRSDLYKKGPKNGDFENEGEARQWFLDLDEYGNYKGYYYKIIECEIKP